MFQNCFSKHPPQQHLALRQHPRSATMPGDDPADSISTDSLSHFSIQPALLAQLSLLLKEIITRPAFCQGVPLLFAFSVPELLLTTWCILLLHSFLSFSLLLISNLHAVIIIFLQTFPPHYLLPFFHWHLYFSSCFIGLLFSLLLSSRLLFSFLGVLLTILH